MRCLYRFFILCWLAALTAGVAHGENYTLTDGQTISGELVSPDEKGAMIRLGDGKYAEVALADGKVTQRIPWAKFSQDDLKKISNDKRAAPHVEPWIDTVPVEKTREKEFTVKSVTRLEHPTAKSFLGGFASTGVGITILFLIYIANLYAAYEIAVVRAYPWPLVCGLSVVAPIIVPIIFLSLPTRVKSREEEEAELQAAQAALEQAAAEQAATAGQAEGAEAAGALALAKRAEEGQSDLPPTQKFARGQFTFNRRFFETKFANFFGIVRREADKELQLIFKTARGQFNAERITRIAANDLHLQVREGPATKEVAIPFIEIQEIVLKHKDAPD